MSDSRSDLSRTDVGASAGLDLSQFHQVFYEEAGENIDNMEQMLLHIDLSQASDEDLKKAWRTLAKKFHPDRVTHLGEDVRRFSEEKFKSIQAAWEQVKQERGL